MAHMKDKEDMASWNKKIQFFCDKATANSSTTMNAQFRDITYLNWFRNIVFFTAYLLSTNKQKSAIFLVLRFFFVLQNPNNLPSSRRVDKRPYLCLLQYLLDVFWIDTVPPQIETSLIE